MLNTLAVRDCRKTSSHCGVVNDCSSAGETLRCVILRIDCSCDRQREGLVRRKGDTDEEAKVEMQVSMDHLLCVDSSLELSTDLASIEADHLNRQESQLADLSRRAKTHLSLI